MANIQNLVKFGENKKYKEQLRKDAAIIAKLSDPLPLMSAKTVKGFVTEYNKLLKKHKADFKKVFDTVPKGVGPGEILLACLHPELTINGGSGSFDVNFGKNEIEVKAVNINKGIASNFRLGVESKPPILKALTDIRQLYNVVKNFVPEIDTQQWQQKVDKGEMTALRKYLQDFDMKKAEGIQQLDVSIHKNLDVKFNKEVIGKISDDGMQEKLSEMATTKYKKIKSYQDIEKELANNLASHKMKYFFFNIKTCELYYKEELSGTFIESITGGIIKVKCDLTK